MWMMRFGPQFMRLFEITPTQFGFLVSIYTVCGSLAGLMAAFVVDHFDRKRTLTLLLGCFVVTAIFCANAFATAMMFAGFIIVPFVNPYMVANVGVKENELAIVYFIGGIVTLFVQRMAGRLSDLHGKRRVFMVFCLISIAPMLLTTHLPVLSLWAAVIASTFFMAIVPSRYVPAMAIITAAADPRLRSSFMSFTAPSSK